MGAGIAEVFARNGLPVVAVERRRGGDRPRPRSHRALDRTRGRPRQAHRPRSSGLLERIDYGTDLGGARRRRSRRRGRARAPRPQAGDLRAAGRGLQARRRSWRPTPHRCRSPRSRCATGRPGKVVGMHFFNPAPVHEARRDRPHASSPSRMSSTTSRRSRRGWARSTSRSATGPGSSPTRCCSATSTTPRAMYESRYATREDIDAAMTLGCGLPDGPARAARPHRPGHRVRDPRHDVRAVPQPAARARRRSSSR